MNAPKCARCGSKMEPGIVMDRADDALRQQEWLEGDPERSIWSGLKTKGKERHPVRTYRCERCGYLESYAIVE